LNTKLSIKEYELLVSLDIFKQIFPLDEQNIANSFLYAVSTDLERKQYAGIICDLVMENLSNQMTLAENGNGAARVNIGNLGFNFRKLLPKMDDELLLLNSLFKETMDKPLRESTQKALNHKWLIISAEYQWVEPFIEALPILERYLLLNPYVGFTSTERFIYYTGEEEVRVKIFDDTLFRNFFQPVSIFLRAQATRTGGLLSEWYWLTENNASVRYP
jgi:hypothetical protein